MVAPIVVVVTVGGGTGTQIAVGTVVELLHVMVGRISQRMKSSVVRVFHQIGHMIVIVARRQDTDMRFAATVAAVIAIACPAIAGATQLLRRLGNIWSVGG